MRDNIDFLSYEKVSNSQHNNLNSSTKNASRDLRGIDTNIIDNTDVLLTTNKLIKNDKSKIKQSG